MRLKSNVEHVFRCMGINILPGINYVSNNKFFKHPAVKARIEEGMFEVEDKEIDLKEHSSKTAKQLIKDIPEMFDLKLLERIKAKESRATVIEAIDKQIKRIKAE